MYNLHTPIGNPQSTLPIQDYIVDPEGNEIGMIFYDPEKPVESKANAMLVVACLNACEEIRPEAVRGMLRTLKALKRNNDHYITCPHPKEPCNTTCLAIAAAVADTVRVPA